MDNHYNNHYNFGIISDNNIILFNNGIHEFKCSNSDALIDVYVTIENGILEIKAKRVIYDLYDNAGYRIFEDQWKHTPHQNEIHEGKKFPWSKKKRFVYAGYVRTYENEPVELIMSNFKIKIYD